MRLVLAVAVLGFAAAPAHACPDQARYAFAVAADGDTPGLADAIDRLSFGSWRGGGVGLVVAGNTVAEPLGPLETLSGSALRTGDATGDAEYAAELAMLAVDHAGYPMHAMIVIGKLDPAARDRLHARAAARHVHLVEYDTADEVGRPRHVHAHPRLIARADVVRVAPHRHPFDLPKWPAFALLGLAALIARRTFMA